jgi:hypothetical protein
MDMSKNILKILRGNEKEKLKANVVSNRHHCTFSTRLSPLLVGVNFGNQPGVAGRGTCPTPSTTRPGALAWPALAVVGGTEGPTAPACC